MKKYPFCENCGAEINPNRFDDSDRCYISNNQTLCKDCFKRECEDYLDVDLDGFAQLIGAEMVYLS